MVSIKNVTNTIPHSTAFNSRTITAPAAMNNVLITTNYFTSVAEKTKSNIKLWPNYYID